MNKETTEKTTPSYAESVVRKTDGTFMVQWTYWHDNNTDDSSYDVIPGDQDYNDMVKRFPNLQPGEATGFDGAIEDAPSRKKVT